MKYGRSELNEERTGCVVPLSPRRLALLASLPSGLLPLASLASLHMAACLLDVANGIQR